MVSTVRISEQVMQAICQMYQALDPPAQQYILGYMAGRMGANLKSTTQEEETLIKKPPMGG